MGMACAAPVDTSSAPVTVTDRQNKSDAAPGPQNLSLTGPQTASRDTNKAALPERPATSSKQKLFAASTSPPQKETVHGPQKKTISTAGQQRSTASSPPPKLLQAAGRQKLSAATSEPSATASFGRGDPGFLEDAAGKRWCGETRLRSAATYPAAQSRTQNAPRKLGHLGQWGKFTCHACKDCSGLCQAAAQACPFKQGPRKNERKETS